jgi:trehalose synthase
MTLRLQELTVLPLERYATQLGSEAMARVSARIASLRSRLSGRAVWNVSSTAVGGGVAEMVRSLLAYARGAGVDARWVVADGPREFFCITKRLHNAIHGSAGDGSPLDDAARDLYERVSASNVAELAPMVRPHDVVIVHDPQPAGMIPALIARGARVVWRCHIGGDVEDVESARAWRFLATYLRGAHAYVFTRATYVASSRLDAARAFVIPPTIDPFSAKNQPLDDGCVRAILARTGLVACDAVDEPSAYTREDGTPGRVDRAADVIRDGPPPPQSAPLVVQVSRWDRLKDPRGVVEGFARIDRARARGAYLVLAGPSANGVADDPESADVLAEVAAARLRLPDDLRRRVHLASLPTADVDENAAIVNALQRHAAVIVQKSLQEGFGLTVTEAMWKRRAVVASAVGGIQDQVEDGVHGLLLADPADLDEFIAAVGQLLDDPARARRMGERGHARVLDRYIGLDSLLRYGALVEWLDDGDRRAPQLDDVRAEL